MQRLMIIAIVTVLATGGAAFAVDEPSQADWATPYQPGLYTSSPDAKTATGEYDFQADEFSNAGTYSTDRTVDYGAGAAIVPIEIEPLPPPPNGAVPEPATMALFGFGLAGAAAAYRKRRAK